MKRNFYLLWATIRPQMFVDTYNYWMKRASGENKIIFKVAVNTEEQKNEILKSLPKLDIRVLGSHIKGVPMASYGLTHDFEAEKDEDIVIWMSDDFYCPDKWDKIIEKDFSDKWHGCLIYRDGIQAGDLATIPIMTYLTLKKLNKVIYNPIFHHCYSDNMLSDNLREMKMLRNLRPTSSVIFEHRHYVNGKRAKDAVDTFVDGKYYEDQVVYLDMIKKPLAERLKPSIYHNKLFSVLIPTMPKRKPYFDRLIENLIKSYSRLNPQQQNEIEVVFLSDDGTKTIGEKRNELIKKANGEYMAFVDDDDLVSDDYYSLILKAIDFKPDVVGMHLLIDWDNNPKSECRVYHSLLHKTWYEEPDPDRPGRKRYFRNPNHLNPVKRLYALYTMFPHLSDQEDRIYSYNILKFLNQEIKINVPLYYYKVRTKKEC